MAQIPTIPQKFATEYLFAKKWDDEEKPRNVFITRHSNHGNWIEDGCWVACIVIGPMNPWYLDNDGIWKYKYGVRFETADNALASVHRSQSITFSYESQKG